MKEFNFPVATEQTGACRSLIMTAQNSSQGMDKFVLWMLTAFGAGLTYLLGKDMARIDNFKVAGFIYLAAVLAAIVQRYLAMLVETGAKGFEQGEKIFKDGDNADFARYLVIYINSLPKLQQTAIAWIAVQMMNGDLVCAGRALYRIALWQIMIGSLGCGLLLWAAIEALQRV
jgi:squalene cyclase